MPIACLRSCPLWRNAQNESFWMDELSLAGLIVSVINRAKKKQGNQKSHSPESQWLMLVGPHFRFQIQILGTLVTRPKSQGDATHAFYEKEIYHPNNRSSQLPYTLNPVFEHLVHSSKFHRYSRLQVVHRSAYRIDNCRKAKSKSV